MEGNRDRERGRGEWCEGKQSDKRGKRYKENTNVYESSLGNLHFYNTIKKTLSFPKPSNCICLQSLSNQHLAPLSFYQWTLSRNKIISVTYSRLKFHSAAVHNSEKRPKNKPLQCLNQLLRCLCRCFHVCSKQLIVFPVSLQPYIRPYIELLRD